MSKKQARGMKARIMIALYLFIAAIFLLEGCNPTPIPLRFDYLTGTSNGGENITTFTGPGSGLAGFDLRFIDDDRHLQELSTGIFDLYEEPRAIVNFADDSGDDRYDWSMIYQTLPVGTVFFEDKGEASGGGLSGLCSSNDMRLPDVIPVLVGFGLSQNDHDIHLKRLEVRLWWSLLNGLCYYEVVFEDKDNYGDVFSYWISYAEVPQRYISAFTPFEGSGTGSAFITGIDVQNPVLQGFDLAFSDDDQHIQNIGVNFYQVRNYPDVYYNLKIEFNGLYPEEEFTYKIYYAGLRE